MKFRFAFLTLLICALTTLGFIVEPVIICTHRGTVGGFCWGVSSRVTQPLRATSVNLFSDFTIRHIHIGQRILELRILLETGL